MEKVIKSIEIFEKSKVTECERKYGSRYVKFNFILKLNFFRLIIANKCWRLLVPPILIIC